MWLNQIIVFNYKSCKKIDAAFSKDDPNILIGINDCGKSSLLKAIGLLLSLKPIFNFATEDKKKSDLSNSKVTILDIDELLKQYNLPNINYTENEAIILGKLILEPQDKEDHRLETYSAHLQWVIDNLTTNEIWLMRIFDTNNQTIKDYILCKDVVEDTIPITLYNESAKNLKDRAKSLKIPNNEIENENKVGRFKNIEYVNAIYKKYLTTEMWVEYSIKDERNVYPEYAYLDWNVSMEQLQQVAKSAINTKIDSYTETLIRFAKRQSAKAQVVVDQELDSFTKQFAVDLPNIQSFKSNIIFSLDSKLTDILINKSNTHGDIHLDSQGDGVKRQIWFALIKWSALNSISDDITNKKFIWCFDEPETHLYPKAQREFFQIIKQVSSKNIQSFISTHSTVFIDKAHFSNIYKFELQNGYTVQSNCTSTTDIFEALQIRNSDFLFYDKFLIVEGDTEEYLIPHLFKLFNGESLNASGIQLINLGGKDKRKSNHALLKSLLKDFNKECENVVYLFDNDVSEALTTSELGELKYYLLGKQDIEDSIDNSVWLEIIKEKLIPHDITITLSELEKLKAEIPTDSKSINSNQKFYPKLKSHLKQKFTNKDHYYLVDDSFPGKGRLSGTMLCSYINDLSCVDKNIIEAFKFLKDN